MSTIHKQSGFSLIEMIVTISIMLLLTGIGISAFFSFKERQDVENAAREIQNALRTAQSKARVRETPSSCFELSAYVVRLDVNKLIIEAQCGPSSYTEVDSKFLQNGITVEENPFKYRFKTLHGGVEIITGSTTIKVKGNGLIYEFKISPGGDITSGKFTP